jgi:hypothetical protein
MPALPPILGCCCGDEVIILCVGLVGVLLYIVLAQIPQTDLPDTAFHNGTAPLVARSRFVPRTPSVLRVTTAARSAAATRLSEGDREQALVHTVRLVRLLPTLLWSLLSVSPIVRSAQCQFEFAPLNGAVMGQMDRAETDVRGGGAGTPTVRLPHFHSFIHVLFRNSMLVL